MSPMWSTPCLNKNANANNANNAENNGVTVVTYSSSSPLPFSPLSPLPLTSSASIKSMEDIWKDINLAFLKDPPDHHRQPASPAAIPPSIDGVGFQGAVLTNFLAGSARDYSPRRSGFESDVPTTRLSLNSSEPDAQGVAAAGRVQVLCGRGGSVGADAPPLAAGISPFYGKRSCDIGGSNDRRDRKFKRSVKNRESAARSRARRQAYTTGLEIEIAHLQKENAKLRRQQEKLRLVPPPMIPKKRRLQRTFTAPF